MQVRITKDYLIARSLGKEKLSIGLINIRSIKNKDALLAEYLRSHEVDLVIVTETWLRQEDEVWKDQNSLVHSGYKISTCDRHKKRGGGLMLCAYNLKMQLLDSDDKTHWQYAVWRVEVTQGVTITVMGIYRVPSLKGYTINGFTEEFVEKYAEVEAIYGDVIVLGDFNIHVDENSDQDAASFLSDTSIMGLNQLVTFTTHRSGHIIDLALQDRNSRFKTISTAGGDHLSDHRFVHIILDIPKVGVERVTKRTINTEDIDPYDLAKEADLGRIYECDTVDSMVERFEVYVKQAMERLTSVSEKIVTNRKRVPWMTKEVKEQRKITRNRERIWRKYGEDHQWEAFKREQRRYRSILNYTKSSVLNIKIRECGRDAKKLFTLVFNITGTTSTNPMPSCSDYHLLANNFADYFNSKINNIRKQLEGTDPFKPKTNESVEILDQWRYPSTDTVRFTVLGMGAKQCETDIIPTALLKKDAQSENEDYLSLCNALSVIFTRSLEEGKFPTAWKCALVKPLIKGRSLDAELKNYRPVSNLQFISKVLEKIILNQLVKHMDQQDLLPQYQSAYRRNHSCETMLVNITDDILWAFERKKCVAMACIDLSAAFDTVDRDILLEVLRLKFGITDRALDLLESYCGPRGFRVKICDSQSDYSDLHYGVAQGSCLGPVLYSCYASTLIDVIPEEIDIHGFADDHSFKKEFTPRIDEVVTVTQLENTLVDVKSWMDANRLKMNDAKTECILFGARQQRPKCETTSVSVNNTVVNVTKSVKLLGADLDSNLSFTEFINKKCIKAWLSLKRIRQMRGMLTKGTCEHLVLSLVITHLDYGNALLVGVGDCHLQKLQRIQNAAAKLVLWKGRYDSSTECLRDLHWLPVKFRIMYKVLTLVYKTTLGEAPAYLCTKINSKKQSGRNLRSNSDIHQLDVPRVLKHTHAARSFSYIGPTWWNQLSLSTRSAIDIVDFKTKLKTELFIKAFN